MMRAEMIKKRILISLIFLVLACLPVSAALPASTSIKAILNTSNDNSSYDIGFSSDTVSSWTDIPARFTADHIVLTPTFQETTKGAVNGNGNKKPVELLYGESDKNGEPTIYVYWKILSFNAVNLSLEIEGPMKNTSAGTLDWCIRWQFKDADGSSVPKELNTKTRKTLLPFAGGKNLGPLDIAKIPKNFIMQGIGGSTALHIITDDLMGKDITSPYQGTMILNISVVE